MNFKITTSELVGNSYRQLFKLSQFSKNILEIQIEIGNKISIIYENQKYQNSDIQITPGEKSVISIVLYKENLNVLFNTILVASIKTNKKANEYLEKCVLCFGGHGPNQKYEYELFKGIVHKCQILYPAKVTEGIVSIQNKVPLKAMKLTTEFEHVDTLEEFYNFDPSYISHMNPILVPLKQRAPSLKKIGGNRQVIICHDPPGFVTEDPHIYGDHIKSNGYRFRFWQNVDYFCYFGHHLVSIPPPGYIAAAHRAGCKIIGAFVTEPGKGELLNDMVLKNMMPGKEGKRIENNEFYYADKLIEICKSYGFDGYLMNFEARILPELLPKLLAWLQYLRIKIKESIPHAEIIWYDSIIADGSVRWQSMLNQHNKMFMEVTDKFFTDYHWGLDHLKISSHTAKEKSWNIFFGNDIYGRGTYAGGQLNTYKAIDEICKLPLSIALFGQAYFYQNGIIKIN